MKWFLAVLLVLGLALTGWGVAITNGPGSADERVGGAFPVLVGLGFIALDIIIAFVWLVART